MFDTDGRTTIYLGTVALEPMRWAAFLGAPDGGAEAPLTQVSALQDRIRDAGFDGIEVWQRHITEAPEAEVRRIVGHALPVGVFNSYVSLDEPEEHERFAIAALAAEVGAHGIKFNTGNDPGSAPAYAERIAGVAGSPRRRHRLAL